ncbi:CHAP domain-containing protein, partial [Staphylococcus pseudintermedius]
TLAHGHDAQAAEYNGGYNPQDPTSYSYSYTIDNQGNYHFTWEGNWSPERFNGGNASASYYTGYDATAGSSYTQPTRTYSAPSYTTQTTSTSSSYSSRDYASSYTGQNTTSISTSTQSTGVTSAGNLYTPGQCTWYVYDKVGGEIGSTWGNANNWASSA